MSRGPMTEIAKVSNGLEIMNTLKGVAGDHRWMGKTQPWADLGFPVIDRGAYAIFPLAVSDPGGAERLSDVRQGLETAFIHFFGGDYFHRENELDIEEGYGRALVAAGAVVRGASMTWWSVGNFAAVLVRSVDQENSAETLALHVIPKDWAGYLPLNAGTKREASRHRRIVKEQTAAGEVDVSWSWPLPASDR